ncbi:MAG TPA: IS1595 family transposase [Rhodospirillaceae bacterium]|jgi:transposase|nr:IS1595 family transposase [Alphaproteobacteria bacterium]HBH25993.1 IS1595 family transposase [Rhodospirillaceae bacterium]
MKQMTVREFFKEFPDDDACLNHLMKVRYGLEHTCRKCGRASRFHRIKSQRAYACQFCGDHLYPCVGTPFERSRTSLQLWFYAIYLFTTTRHGVSAKELERQLGVTYKCAHRMGHEIRKHMAAVDGEAPLSGTVEIDETIVGGKHERKDGKDTRPILLGMLEKGGDVMTKVVPDVKRASLYPHITANITEGAAVHTDELRSYATLGDEGYVHTTVCHGRDEYVAPDGTTVNGLEGYWAMLTNGIRSTHIHVSTKHLEKYAKEFEYRYNARANPSQMTRELLTVFPKS